MVRVLICDDHALVREGLKLVLATVPDFQVHTTGSRELEMSRTPLVGLWDVLVLDVTMPGMESLKRLKQLCSTVPVLVISIHSEENCGVHMLRAGAAGFITTSSSPAEMVRAIRRVAAGGKYISAAMAEALADRLDNHDEQPPGELLSSREFEVFLRLAAGERPTSIAQALKLSIKTISTYRSRILEKLHLKTNCHLFHYAIQRDLVFGLNEGHAGSGAAFARRPEASMRDSAA